MADEPIKIKSKGRGAPSILSNNLTVIGRIISQGEVQIDGHLQGDARANSLTVGEEAKVDGELCGDMITVRGKVKGTIRGKQVHLCTSAVVNGDIFHTALAVEAGATFNGSVKREKDPLADAAIKADPNDIEKVRAS